MRESKGEMTTRLRREGRWEEFVARREALKAGGMSAAEAWTEAAAEFPPASETDAGPETQEPVREYDLSPLAGKPQIPMAKAVLWAFENLDSPTVTPADAPSAGAWTMLTWARRNNDTRSEFMRTFMAKLMPNRQQVEELEKWTDEGVEVLEMIEVCRQAQLDAAGSGMRRNRSVARAVIQDELCPDCLLSMQSKGIATLRQVEDLDFDGRG